MTSASAASAIRANSAWNAPCDVLVQCRSPIAARRTTLSAIGAADDYKSYAKDRTTVESVNRPRACSHLADAGAREAPAGASDRHSVRHYWCAGSRAHVGIRARA